MPYISTEIKSYSYMLFPKQDTTGKIALYNTTDTIFGTIYVRPDSETIATPIIDATGQYRMYIHRKYLADVLDMLRNEKPVHFHYWEGGGGNSHLGTTREPVGENE
jgi:hypothetical protein